MKSRNACCSGTDGFSGNFTLIVCKRYQACCPSCALLSKCFSVHGNVPCTPYLKVSFPILDIMAFFGRLNNASLPNAEFHEVLKFEEFFSRCFIDGSVIISTPIHRRPRIIVMKSRVLTLFSVTISFFKKDFFRANERPEKAATA
jgi:hypothetical protein